MEKWLDRLRVVVGGRAQGRQWPDDVTSPGQLLGELGPDRPLLGAEEADRLEDALQAIEEDVAMMLRIGHGVLRRVRIGCPPQVDAEQLGAGVHARLGALGRYEVDVVVEDADSAAILGFRFEAV
jgi:hypothetical protein